MDTKNESARHAVKFPGKQHNGQKMENERTGKTRSTTSNDNRCAEAAQSGADEYTDKQKANAARKDAKARLFRSLNPDLFAKLEKHALNETAHKRRFSVQRWIEEVRWKDHVNRIGESVKINNDFAPIFARMLVTEHPEVRGFIELRKSVYDLLYPGAFSSDDE